MLFNRSLLVCFCCAIATFGSLPPVFSNEPLPWNQFRGPTGQGVAASDSVTMDFSASKIRWRTPIPEVGWSSPITDGKRLWITAARVTEATKQQKEAKLANVSMATMKDVAGRVELFGYCLDLETGKLLLNIPLHTVDSPNPIHPMNGYASPTGVFVDNKAVLHFGQYGTWCLNAVTGQVLWRRELVVDDSVGPGSSLIVHNDKILVTCDGMDKQFITALDLNTGNEVWRTSRPPLATDNGEYRKSYSTPLLIRVAGKIQAVIPGSQWCVTYDPDTGKELWRVDHGKGFSITPMPVFVDGKVIMSTGYGKPDLVAINPTGTGDITSTNVLWRESRSGPVMPSMACVDSLLYAMSDGGILSAVNVRDGSQVWRQRIGGKYSSSPFVSGKNIVIGDHDGNLTVFQAGDSYRELAKFELGEQIMASPIAVGDDVILRTKDAVYRFAK